ncbi:ThiF family adenylyltransferase [Olivibacter domesticus]|uniref:tRNA A37 threonylcarbamoyladenosine dehydratase n=1 Tax=Olivibacter domesticus TaxID=407022 RepID=A0A1H7YY08_OLID1|nr:ThiF family adenylyltransferase [Olivibacter domesticus]SEM50079.1 tRNA A37 threonylcarbamoyladenosine dehydratase [Olivibacter domesticus]
MNYFRMEPENTIYHNSSTVYRPVFFRRVNDKEKMDYLLENNKEIHIIDQIEAQLVELIRLDHPSKKLTESEQRIFIDNHIGATSLYDYGVWVYYQWLNQLIHILDEEEFIRIRTSRNIYKITPEEINLLRKKKVGVIGLSVGQSIAITMAMERICGELRLADFDTIELSNMNRLRVGVQHLGLSKTIVAARQIAELDPFIKVICYTNGVDGENIDSFFLDEGKLDILVEECDGIDMKIISRIKAKQYQIPVIMDTNDKGMLDVERFDLDPERPIFHGRLKRVDGLSVIELEQLLNQLTVQDKVEYLVDIIGFENVSDAMKLSLQYMNKTIVGWPQLASAVTLGGAMVTDITRKIFLGKFESSGRYFVDFDELIQP